MTSNKLNQRWLPHRPHQIIILDNRDSFVYNLAHRLFEAEAREQAEESKPAAVVRSDQLTLPDLIHWQPAALIISPGPGHPRDAGISVQAIRHFSGQIPILGICLGHQAIATAFGGRVEPNGTPVHGKASIAQHNARGLFAGLPPELTIGRYHSLIVREPLPETLRVTARTRGLIMALEHRTHPTFGIQFHPESILTPDGQTMLQNFLQLARPPARV